MRPQNSNLAELYRDVKTSLESTSTSKGSQPKKYFTPTKENNQRKHSLNTPHGSSPSCKTLCTKSPNKPARKSLTFENVLVENRLDDCLNIEDLTNEGLQLKVVFVSNGTRSVTTRIRREKRIKYLIRQLYKTFDIRCSGSGSRSKPLSVQNSRALSNLSSSHAIEDKINL